MVKSNGFISNDGVNWKLCACGNTYYNSDKFDECFSCSMIEKGFVKCQLCKKSWHHPKFPTCFKCSKSEVEN